MKVKKSGKKPDPAAKRAKLTQQRANRAKLTDGAVRGLILASTGLAAHRVSTALVDAKRAHLEIDRAAMQLRKNVNATLAAVHKGRMESDEAADAIYGLLSDWRTRWA